MKKLLFLIILAGIVLFATQAWAHTYTYTSILTSAVGTAKLESYVWDPSDTAAGNTYFGTGFWGYFYDIKNIDYNTYLTNFDIMKAPFVTVTYVSAPSGWTTYTTANSFGWSNTSGLYTGSTASGFEVKSTMWKDTILADAWRPGNPTAFGLALAPAIPEPTSALLLGMGILGLCALRRRTT